MCSLLIILKQIVSRKMNEEYGQHPLYTHPLVIDVRHRMFVLAVEVVVTHYGDGGHVVVVVVMVVMVVVVMVTSWSSSSRC
jgi:hypothetical protein